MVEHVFIVLLTKLHVVMAAQSFPIRNPPSHNYFSNIDKLSEYLPIAIKDGPDLISLIAIAKENRLPQTHPKNIKDKLVTKVPHHQNIDSIKLCAREN